MWRPSEPFSRRTAARRRQEAYLEVMRRTAEVYAFAEQVAPELGLSAEELVEHGRRFWLRAWQVGARGPQDIDHFIASGQGLALPRPLGEEDSFALPSFSSAPPRMALPAISLRDVRVTLDEILRRPISSAAE